MKKIVILCPYFGKLPNYFPFVLESMKSNVNIDWIVFTDDETEYKSADNIIFIYTTLKDIKTKLKKLIPYDISLDAPYKLCDYKPFYGLIWDEKVIEYDYWGFCDFDCIFGDIRAFINDEIEREFDKILFLGHLSLWKNNIRVISFLKKIINDDDVKKALQLPRVFKQIDEITVPLKMKENGMKIAFLNGNSNIADVYTKTKRFIVNDNWLVQDNESIITKNTLQSATVFGYCKGKLFGYDLFNNDLRIKEYMYVHFQKRNLSINTNECDSFLIIPNMIVTYKHVDINYLINYGDVRGIYWKRYVISIKYHINRFLYKFYESIWMIRKTISKILKRGFNG